VEITNQPKKDSDRVETMGLEPTTPCVKLKDGRRNRYRIQDHLPLREAITQQRSIGEVLDILVESKIPSQRSRAPA